MVMDGNIDMLIYIFFFLSNIVVAHMGFGVVNGEHTYIKNDFMKLRLGIVFRNALNRK